MTDEEFLKLCKEKNNEGFEPIKDYINKKGKFKLIKGPNNITPLHIAIRFKNNMIVKLLLDNGFNPMTTDNTRKRKTALVEAIITSNIEAILLILNSTFKPLSVKNRYSEFSALADNLDISYENFNIILSKLVAAGLDIDMLDSTKKNILVKNVITNDINKVKACVANGADVNNQYIHIMHYAFMGSNELNIDIIKFLLDNGAHIYNHSENSWEEYNLLEWAHSKDEEEVFELLIREYNALEFLKKDMIQSIIQDKDIKYLKYLWEIPQVHDFIIKNNLDEAFPKSVRDVFIF